jgi:hypothetical protein
MPASKIIGGAIISAITGLGFLDMMRPPENEVAVLEVGGRGRFFCFSWLWGLGNYAWKRGYHWRTSSASEDIDGTRCADLSRASVDVASFKTENSKFCRTT